MKKYILGLALLFVLVAPVNAHALSIVNNKGTDFEPAIREMVAKVCDEQIIKNRPFPSVAGVPDDYYQLQQRVTSLESRFGALEKALDSISALMTRIGSLLGQLTLKK